MGNADAPALETRQAAPRASMAKNAFHLVLGQVATTALAIVFSAALGRTLGAGDFGLYFLISRFVDLRLRGRRLGAAVRRHPRGRPHSFAGGDLLGSALGLRSAGGVLAAIPAGLLTWALGYDARTCWFTVAFMLVMLPFFLSQGFSFASLRGRDRMELDAATSVVNKSVGLVLALAALALGTGLGGVVFAQALGGGAALLVAARLYRRVATGPCAPAGRPPGSCSRAAPASSA